MNEKILFAARKFKERIVRKGKRYEKRILSVALVVAMATTMFAGCGKNQTRKLKMLFQVLM